ncbi:snake venom vascular endothelial growth factor toxin ICPP [Hoplias malabaricus]|uniref:snake venom vascular endothelial growth factor toxin ICPP n=1 Tax=Hoplias malabaricus TaxID=27720 RepID=UPI0034621FE9
MVSLVSLTQIFTTVALQIQVSTPLRATHSEVMLFHDVWTRSLCRSLEKLVSVEEEYPGNVEYIFSPSCVPLQRCSGCCNDEKLECFPTLTHNVTMQLVRISPAQRTRQYVQLSFLEHHTCECRPRWNHTKYQSYRQQKNRPRRRRKRKRGKRRAADCGKYRNQLS